MKSRTKPNSREVGVRTSVRSYKKILVCYDGSENAMRGLERAINIMKTSGGELTILVVVETLTYRVYNLARYYHDLRDDMLDYGKEMLSRALEVAKVRGVPEAKGCIEEGHPADMILAKCADLNADLIVMGRRGLRGIQRYLLGSVSSAVVDHSKCDVLIVK